MMNNKLNLLVVNKFYTEHRKYTKEKSICRQPKFSINKKLNEK